MPKRMTTGRAAFLQLLIDEGVTHLFGNPGTTELAIMEAVPQFPELKYVLGLQESVVLGMADGYARASGKLAAVNLHCTPGLGHAMGALYSAKFSGSPLIITAGQYEIGYGLQEPLLYEPLVPIAQPLVKWAVEVTRIQDLPRIIRRAAKIALTPPMGPVFISLPGSILDDAAELDFGSPTRVETGTRPGDEAIERLALRLLMAEKPVLIAGRELAHRNVLEEAGELANLLGAAVYQEPVPYNARFPSDHPACMGDLTRNQVQVRKTLEQYDLLLCLGADLLRMSPYSPVEPLPDGMPVIHITERDWELGNPARESACNGETSCFIQTDRPALFDAESGRRAAGKRDRGGGSVDGGAVSRQLPADAGCQQLLWIGQRWAGFCRTGCDRHQPGSARASGGRGDRGWQCDVWHPGALDGGAPEASDHLRHRQQSQLSDHQGTPGGIAQDRPVRGHGHEGSADRFHGRGEGTGTNSRLRH